MAMRGDTVAGAVHLDVSHGSRRRRGSAMTEDARRSVLTDAEALDAIRAGDPAGVDGLYTHHGWAVHDFCRAVVRDDAEAASLTVDTFVAAVPLLTALDEPGRVRPLLLAAARGEVLRRGRCGRPRRPRGHRGRAGRRGRARPRRPRDVVLGLAR